MIKNLKKRKAVNGSMKAVISSIAVFNIVIVILIFLFLFVNSLKFFNEVSIFEFLSGKIWIPSSGRFGMLPLLLGSFWVALIAMSIAVPLGIISAVYLSEYANKKIRETLKIIIETMAAIPSVVLGYIGIVVVAEPVRRIFDLDTGFTALTGGIILGFMALPTIISMSDDALKAVKPSYRYASLALGANRLETVVKVIFPAALPGIFASTMLGAGRIIGETMVVLMVTGNSPNVNAGPLRAVTTMTATIASETGQVARNTTHYYSLFAIGFILFLITLSINTLSSYFVEKERKRMKG